RVTVLDGGTLREVTTFFAYDVTFRGGVWVAAGDIDGDGRADLVTGAGAGYRPEVRVVNGNGWATWANFTAEAEPFGGGVRVALCDLDGDGQAEIVTGAGPGGGQLRLFDAPGGKPIDSLAPFGESFYDGLFVGAFSPGGGAGGSGGRGGRTPPVVTAAATTNGAAPSTNAVFTLTRTDTTGDLVVCYTLAGTASMGVGGDLNAQADNVVTIPSGSATATVTVTVNDDSAYEGTETVALTVCAGSGYTVGTPASA